MYFLQHYYKYYNFVTATFGIISCVQYFVNFFIYLFLNTQITQFFFSFLLFIFLCYFTVS